MVSVRALGSKFSVWYAIQNQIVTLFVVLCLVRGQ